MKKTLCITNMKGALEPTVVERCISTVDGLESAHVNMSTGEITYSKDACIDEEMLRQAFEKEGLCIQERVK